MRITSPSTHKTDPLTQLYYLGPEHTWSHAAALQAKQMMPPLSETKLVPLKSADLLFERAVQEPQSAVIIPTYNLEQGIVFDFARFQLFEEIGSLELKTRMCLFGRAKTVQELKRIYTKDTVLPQVSRWLAKLPAHIELVARPDISTAGGVALAAAEPGAGAICSEAAGKAHQLHPLELGIANNRDNYTAFSLFRNNFAHPHNFIHLLNTPPEYGFGIDEKVATQAKNGELTVLWHLSGVHNRTLHLGHMSAILTLQKLAKLGNAILVQIEAGPHLPALKKRLTELLGTYSLTFETAPDRQAIYKPEAIPEKMRVSLEKRADIQGCDRVAGRESLKLKLTCNHQVLLYAVQETNIDLVVAGPSLLPDLKMIAAHFGRVIPTILTDYLPGTDNYAKMSAKRGNQIDWPLSTDLSQVDLNRNMLDIHFSAERMPRISIFA